MVPKAVDADEEGDDDDESESDDDDDEVCGVVYATSVDYTFPLLSTGQCVSCECEA